MKGLEGKLCEEWFAQSRADELRGGLMAATAPHREWTGMEQATHGNGNGPKLLEFKGQIGS